MTTTLQIKLNKSYNSFQIRSDKSHDPTMPRIDLGMSLSVRPIYELAKSLIKTNSKVHKHKTYN